MTTTVDVIAPNPTAARELLDEVDERVDAGIVEARALHHIPPASRVRWSRTASARGAVMGGALGAWCAGLLTLVVAFVADGLAGWTAVFGLVAGFGFGALAGALAGLAGRDHRMRGLARRLGGDRVAVMFRVDDREVRPERVAAIASQHGEVVTA